MSELLGKWTIDKQSNGRTFGSHGSSSRNEDIFGRELMTPDEVARMDNNHCLVFIRGQYPIYDKKWDLFHHPLHLEAKKMGSYAYLPDIEEDPLTGQLTTLRREAAFQVLTEKSLAYYKKAKEHHENVEIIQMTEEELNQINLQDEEETLEQISTELKKNAGNKHMLNTNKEEPSVLQLLKENDFTEEQKDEIWKGLQDGLTEEQIRQYANPKYSADKMKLLRNLINII